MHNPIIIFTIPVFFILTFNCAYPSTSNIKRDPFNIPKKTKTHQELYTKIIPFYYRNAEHIGKLIKDNRDNFLSPQGNVTINKNSNSIWVRDHKSNIEKISNFMKDIDKSSPQIKIEARIVNIDSNILNELGITINSTKSTSSSDKLYVDIPSSNSNTGNFDFTLAKLGDSNTLDLELSALESEGKVQIISQPNLITINKKPAYIEAGEDVPYQEKTGEGNTSTNFKKAVLQLKVTPKILSNNKILLDIDISQDNVTSLMINGVPAIETKRIKTQTLVKNRQTVVLGGIHEQNRNTQTNKIPLLGSIPIIGALFRDKNTEMQHKELLIFITPKIIN